MHELQGNLGFQGERRTLQGLQRVEDIIGRQWGKRREVDTSLFRGGSLVEQTKQFLDYVVDEDPLLVLVGLYCLGVWARWLPVTIILRKE